MDVRNVQKTGNMFYVYLPTSWCRKYNVKANSKVAVSTDNEGSLVVSHHLTERKANNLVIDLHDDDLSVINRLLVASFINPTTSFRINLVKPVDIQKLLHQKKLISIATVEFDDKHIGCESGLAVEDPISLLKTMVRKVKNLIAVLKRDYDKELIGIYEDEIDRSKLLIEKSVISRFTLHEQSNVKTIYLHYTALLSKDLEKAVDQLPLIEKKETVFMGSVEQCIDSLLAILEKLTSSNKMEIDHKDAISFAKKVDLIRVAQSAGSGAYAKIHVKQLLSNISEVLFDWAVSRMVEDKQDKVAITKRL